MSILRYRVNNIELSDAKCPFLNYLIHIHTINCDYLYGYLGLIFTTTNSNFLKMNENFVFCIFSEKHVNLLIFNISLKKLHK